MPTVNVTVSHALAVALCAGALGACGKKPDTQPNASATFSQEPPRPVRSMIVGASDVNDVLYLPGDVRARHEVRYGFRVGGKIARRNVELGQTVAAGAVLASLDSTDVMPQINAQSAQVEAARANASFQQSDLKRQQELREKGFISAAAVERQLSSTDAALAQERAARSTLANARNALAFQTLRSDKAGVVVGIDAEAGNVVSAGQSVVRVAQSGELEVLVNVPERSLGLVREAKSVQVAIDAIPGQLFAATLRELAPSADPVTRTFAARFALPSAPQDIKLGMTATARIAQSERKALTVPLSAVTTRDGQSKVWIVDPANQAVQPINISTGAMQGESIVVASGLAAGQRVVTAGASLLIAGQKVRVLDNPAPAAEQPAKAEAQK